MLPVTYIRICIYIMIYVFYAGGGRHLHLPFIRLSVCQKFQFCDKGGKVRTSVSYGHISSFLIYYLSYFQNPFQWKQVGRHLLHYSITKDFLIFLYTILYHTSRHHEEKIADSNSVQLISVSAVTNIFFLWFYDDCWRTFMMIRVQSHNISAVVVQ